MAKIKNAKVKESSGGYIRLFGNPALGLLFSKAHSTVISSGVELEKLILSIVKQIEDLDVFLDLEIMPEGVLVASKKTIKTSMKIDFAGSEPDFMIFKRRNNKQHCSIVELKDGHTFDTKKAAGERDSMHSFIRNNAQYLPYTVSSHFYAFNQEDRLSIQRGFKHKITIDECLTGREFCDLLEIDYEGIIASRKKDQKDNLTYFLLELLKIREIKEFFVRQLHS